MGPVSAIIVAPRKSSTRGGCSPSSAASSSPGVICGTAENLRKRYFCHSFQSSQTPSANAASSKALPAWRSSMAIASGTAPRNTQPTAIASPAHKPAPTAEASRKPGSDMRKAPAIGGATVEKPGMNLATTSEEMPQRMNLASV